MQKISNQNLPEPVLASSPAFKPSQILITSKSQNQFRHQISFSRSSSQVQVTKIKRSFYKQTLQGKIKNQNQKPKTKTAKV
jgi:hypothetical protein